MERRTFVKGIIGGGAVMGAGVFGWHSIRPYEGPLTTAHTLAYVDNLMQQQLTTTGQWSLFKILTHCAQSVEYSLSGYPLHKSEWFKSIVGKNAFSAFHAKRKMTHDLAEAIPGAPAIAMQGDVNDAYLRFRESLLEFDAFDGQLAPHFAYGKLTKAQYEAAHAMHFNNHFIEITQAV